MKNVHVLELRVASFRVHLSGCPLDFGCLLDGVDLGAMGLGLYILVPHDPYHLLELSLVLPELLVFQFELVGLFLMHFASYTFLIVINSQPLF